MKIDCYAQSIHAIVGPKNVPIVSRLLLCPCGVFACGRCRLVAPGVPVVQPTQRTSAESDPRQKRRAALTRFLRHMGSVLGESGYVESERRMIDRGQMNFGRRLPRHHAKAYLCLVDHYEYPFRSVSSWSA